MTQQPLVPVVVDLVPDLVPVAVRPLPKDRHPAYVYLTRLAPGSRRTMAQALTVIAGLFHQTPETLDWPRLRYQHTQAVRTRLAETRSPAGVNKILAALRGVLKEAWRLGLMTAEDFHRAADLPGVRGERLPRGRALSRRELQKLFVACAKDTSSIGRRDAGLIAVLYGGGLRRSEVVGFDLGDYHAETGELRVRDGKGRKERIAYATDGAKDALDAWLAVRGTEPGPLFWPADGRGRPLVKRRMSDQAILLMLRRRAADAKIASFTPHDLRRSFISDLLDAGADMVTVQKLAGHANVQTTARYDRRGEETKKRAAELLRVPFVAA
jgi:integrase